MTANTERVGPYEVIEALHALADELEPQVYVAVDNGGRRVFLATLHGPRATTAQDVHRVRRIAALGHSDLPPLVDEGTLVDGTTYLCWRHHRGENLRARLEREAPRPREAVRIALGIARGLEAAHRAGLAHGNLRPANIVLGTSGVVLVGVGLEARRAGAGATPEGRAGAAYCAPEQLAGEPATASSDVWSFGVILYEMLAADLPFAGSSYGAMSRAIASQEPYPLAVVPGVLPFELETTIDACLARRPDQRFADASTLALNLEALELRLDPPSTPSVSVPASARVSVGSSRQEQLDQWLKTRRRRLRDQEVPLRDLLLVPSLLLVLVVAVGGWLWCRERLPPGAGRPAAEIQNARAGGP